MKKPSPNLDSQIKAQEQKLSILQTTVKASEKEWADRKRQIADDTQVTIEVSKKAIASELRAAKKELLETQEKAKKTAQEFFRHRQAQEDIVSKVEAEIEDLQYTKKVLLQTNTDLAIENRELKSAITVLQADSQMLKEDERELNKRLVDLREAEKTLAQQKSDLDAEIEDHENALESFVVEADAKRQQLEQSIVALELKKQDLANEIIENRAQDDKVRDNLAQWEQKLADSDKNLRIREARVNQQESAIARNYNLLQL